MSFRRTDSEEPVPTRFVALMDALVAFVLLGGTLLTFVANGP